MMENTTNNPQAFYTKMPSDVQNSSGFSSQPPANTPMQPPIQKPKRNFRRRPNSTKNVLAVAGLVFFVIVALTGVFIAQKQISRDGEVRPVAPTAPESQPQASSDDNNECVTTFFVAKGSAKCDEKVALTDFSVNGGQKIPADSNFNVGDSFVFQINVSSSDDTSGNVKMVDKLPESLRFVVDENNSEGIINNGRDVVYNFGELQKDEEVSIEFRVEVILESGRETNSAKITTNDDSDTQSSCGYRYTTVIGTAECIDKVMYDGDPANGGDVVPEGSALTRGDEYVYYITVKARNRTFGKVKVRDVIPSGVEFVRPLPASAQYIENQAGDSVIIADLGQLDNEELGVGFVVRVVDDPSIGEFTNSAEVYIDDEGNVLGDADPIVSVPNSWTTLDTKGLPDCPSGWQSVASGKGNGNDDHDNPLFTWTASVAGNAKFIGEDNDPKENDDLGGHGVTKVGVDTWLVPTQDPDDDGWGYESNTFQVQPGDKYEAFVGDDSGEMALCFRANSTTQTDICAVTHSIVPVGTAQCIEKQAYEDFNGDRISANSSVSPGQEFVFKILVQANDTTTGDVVVLDTLPLDLTFVNDDQNTSGVTYNSNNRQVRYNFGVINNNEIRSISFKVRVSDNPSADEFENVAAVTTNDNTSHYCSISLDYETPEEEYDCNVSCETDAQCQTADYSYICYGSTGDKVCRLGENPSSTSCNMPNETPTPTPTPTPTTTPIAAATPAPGCNDLCVSNADCSNTSHICLDTDDGTTRCRLASYPDSQTCTVPVEDQQLADQQPDLPEILPETGPADWLNWLKAGLVTLGVGTALFLLL